MLKIIPYITCSNAEELINHYKLIFNDIVAKRNILTEEMAKKINYPQGAGKSHVEFDLYGEKIMASDDLQGEEATKQTILLNFSLSEESNLTKLKKIAENFENNEECDVIMPLKEQHWGGISGQYSDKFGNIFMLIAQ